MGAGILLSCKDCDYEYEFLVGRGFWNPVRFQSTFEERGPEDDWIVDFFTKHPEGAINRYHQLYCCPDCGEIENLCLDTLYYELTEKGKEWMEKGDTWDLGCFLEKAYVKAIPFDHRCSRCGGKLESIESWEQDIENGRLRCPRCGGELESEYTLDWD